MVAIELEYGYGNSAKGGRELPLTLSLKNEEQTELKGTLEILTRQSDGECYAYEYPLELAAAETQRAQYVVPIGVGSDQLVLLIKNEAGELVSESSHTLNINVTTPELFIGILSDRPEALSYLDRASVNYGQLRTHSYVLAGDSFPPERVEFKQAVADSVVNLITPIQQKYEYFLNNKELLDKILDDGALKASSYARKTISKVKRKMGLIRK